MPVTKCPAIVKDGNYKDFGQVVVKLVEVIGMYNECAAKHNALVETKKGK